MGELKSSLFTSGDPATNAKLEACATGTPSEVASHFTIGAQGDHIRRLQLALRVYKNVHPSAGISDFPVDGTYSKAFATAVGQYKAAQVPKILNYAGKIDEIIGIKTIKSLDKEAQGSDVIPPLPVPIEPPVVFPGKRIARRVFVNSTRSGGKLPGGDDGFKDIQDALANLANSLQDPLFWLGTEDMSQRQTIVVNDDFRVNFVLQSITTIVTETPTFGDTIVSSQTTTELVYTYGASLPTVLLSTKFHSEFSGEKTDTFNMVIVPRDAAQKSLLLNPPRP